MAEDYKRSYSPAGPVLRNFHRSNAFFRGIMGPYGSGKSTACVTEIIRRAGEQQKASDGIRYSRWGIVRNTYPELKTTTLKTWAEWVPLDYGKFTQDKPIRHYIRTADLDMEVYFLALDQPDDIRKLGSFEFTGIWLNEAREIPKVILDAATGRVRRYPGANRGGITWTGVIADTNPADTESWWYKYAEGDVPTGWEFFRQPSGLSPDAENLQWLNQTAESIVLPENNPERRARGRRYYEDFSQGKDPDFVKVYVHGEYGFVTEGQPVYPNYRDSTHCAPQKFDAVPGLPLLLGADFGLTPACVIAQHLPDGRWIVVDEFVTEDMGIQRFAENLKTYMAIQYPDHMIGGGWGDPAGNQRAFSDERTALEIMGAVTGWRWRPAAKTNDMDVRLEVVKAGLNRMVDGKPGLLVSPKCRVLREGFASKYARKFVKNTEGGQMHEAPTKNKWSHPHDALQYLLLGSGEYSAILGRKSGRQRGTWDHRTGRFVDPMTGLPVPPRGKVDGVDNDLFGE